MKNTSLHLLVFLTVFSFFSFAKPVVWVPTNIEKVLRDQKPPSELPLPVLHFEAAKNEYEGAQLIIHAKDRDLENVNVSFSDLTHVSSNSCIKSDQIKVFLQHYIEVYRTTTSFFPKGWYPDALPPLVDSFDVKKGRNQGLWFSLKVPKGQQAGVYKGELTLTFNNEALQVPVELTVWDFELSDENHTDTAFAIRNGQVATAHGVTGAGEDYWELIEKYYWFQTDYRLPPNDLPIPTDDVEEYLEKAERFLTDPRVSSFRIPYYVDNPQKTKQMVDGLRERGWLSKGYFYLAGLIDEPSADQYPFVRELCLELNEIAPDVRHIVTEKPVMELEGYVNTWCPPTHRYDPEVIEMRREAGDNIWWYTCIAPKYPYSSYHIDDHLVGARVLSWMQKYHRVEGNLYWSTTIFQKHDGKQWNPKDPWKDPLGSPDGANGDGLLLYPGTDGPVASLRLEAIRDGMEDYEYLWMLEHRMQDIAKKLEVQNEFNVENAFVTYYSPLFQSLKDYNSDPKVLQKIRSEVARDIVDIYKGPFALIEVEKVSVKDKSEFVIYAEAGTKVKVNGEEVKAVGKTGKADKFNVKLCLTPGLQNVEFDFEKAGKRKQVIKTIFVQDLSDELELYPVEISYFETEDDLKRWAQTNVKLSLSEEHSSQGNKSLKAEYASGVAFPNIRLLGESAFRSSDWTEYKFITFDVYNPHEGRRAELYCKFHQIGGVADDNTVFYVDPGQWTTIRVPLNFKTIDLSKMLGFEIWMWQQSSPFTLYFDNFYFLSSNSNPEPILPLAKPQRKLGPELVNNGGFEEEIGGRLLYWTYNSSGKSRIGVTGNVVHNGKNAIEIIRADDTESTSVGVGQRIKVEPNTRYLLSAFVKTEMLIDPTYPKLGAYLYDSNGNFVGGAWPITTHNTSDFEYYEAVLQTGSAVTEIELRCEIYTPKGTVAQGKVWLDDFSLRKIEGY